MTDTPPRHSLITGGGGFVGRHLVDALRARGDRVTVVELAGASHREDVTWINADIRDAEAVSQAISDDVDCVFHNASVVHTKRNQEEVIWGVNLDGSKNVLAACRQRRVGRLVYVSTASAVYEGRDVVNGDELLPYSTISQAPYADSKIAAEKLILAADGADGVRTCAIRPHVIFGPGDTRFLPAIIDRASRGKLRFSVGWGKKLSDFTYVDNLTDALLRAADRLGPDTAIGGQAYFVTNGEPMAFFDFVGEVLEQLDLPPIVGAVPFPVAYAVASVAEAYDTYVRGGTLNAENGLSRFAVKYLCTHHWFNIDKARRDLGYEPQVSIAEGIERTVAHLVATDRVPRRAAA